MPIAETTPNTEVDTTTTSTTDAGSTAAPSTDTTTDSTATGTPEAGKTADDGGEAKKGEDAAPKTALEAAQRVMAKEAKPASTEDKSQGKPAADAAATDKGAAKPEGEAAVEAEDAKLPFKDHPRWKQLSSEVRILRVAKEKNEDAIKQLEPKAKTYDDLSNYLRTNNLGREDFESGINIMTAIRNDPAKGYELLRPVMERLEALVGVRLPADLQAKVDAGTVDADTARELAKTRGRVEIESNARETLEQRQAREATEREQGTVNQQMTAVTNELNAWDSEWGKRDPDAAKLRPFVLDLLLLEGQRNPPRDAESARKLAETCLAEARKRVATFAPAPEPKGGPLPTSGASTATTTPVPKSSLEAAQAALRMAGA